MAVTSCLTFSKDPRRIARRVMIPTKTSTRFSHEPEVGGEVQRDSRVALEPLVDVAGSAAPISRKSPAQEGILATDRTEPTCRRAELLLICARLQRQPVVGGGALAWWVVRVGCARTPSLISVRDPGWFRVGDMMGDGVFRDAVRPLGL